MMLWLLTLTCFAIMCDFDLLKLAFLVICIDINARMIPLCLGEASKIFYSTVCYYSLVFLCTNLRLCVFSFKLIELLQEREGKGK